MSSTCVPSLRIHPSYFAKCSFKFRSVCPATLFPTVRHFVAQSCPNSYSSYIGGPNGKALSIPSQRWSKFETFYPESVQGFLMPITINESGPTYSGTGMAFDPVKIRWGWAYNVLRISPKLKMVTNNSKLKISSDQ
jgi:hypothetical protein